MYDKIHALSSTLVGRMSSPTLELDDDDFDSVGSTDSGPRSKKMKLQSSSKSYICMHGNADTVFHLIRLNPCNNCRFKTDRQGLCCRNAETKV